MKPRVIGKGLIEKRGRILRCLDAHLRYLATVERMAPWTPSAFGHEPRPRQTPEEWAARWERYAPPRYVYPRERPTLAHPCSGAEELSEEQVKAWVEGDDASSAAGSRRRPSGPWRGSPPLSRKGVGVLTLLGRRRALAPRDADDVDSTPRSESHAHEPGR